MKLSDPCPLCESTGLLEQAPDVWEPCSECDGKGHVANADGAEILLFLTRMGYEK